MRPGPRGPGNLEARAEDPYNINSFNEAGAARPRKFRVHIRYRRVYNGFNEAGAARPRKSRDVRTARQITESFNEAGAARPRKSA